MASTESNRLILKLSCEDKSGIVSAVTTFLHQNTGFIIDADQFGDPITKRFFMRAEFSCLESSDEIRRRFKTIANIFNMDYHVFDKNRKRNIIIAVTKESHCLAHLLYKWEVGALNANIKAIVSNHNDLRPFVERYGLEYVYLPITPEENGKKHQEQKLLEIVRAENVELLVLARYMQVLGKEITHELSGKAINIHHSFLPGFKGAKPYNQAYDRGVKIIGATSHYITEDLDEGPIIEQEVTRVRHDDSVSDLKLLGQDIESRVLFRAVKWHLEHRIILNDSKTVIFD
jgi:formyltetrahydrofolate deformylase